MNKLILVALVLGTVALAAAQRGTTPPAGWTCSSREATYNQRSRSQYPGQPVVCDCGCGVWDTDCDVATKTPQDLDYAYYVDISCPTANGGRELRDGGSWACSYVEQGCVRVPDNWSCEPNWYNQSLSDKGNTGHDKTASTSNGVLPACHCGCGAADPDCGVIRDVDSDVHDLFCNSRAFAALDSVNLVKSNPDKFYCNTPTDNCQQVPAGWTCPAHWYNEYVSGSVAFGKHPTCNCGCGVWDPDCEFEAYRFADTTWGLRCGAENVEVLDQLTFCNRTSLTCVNAPDGWTCAGRYYSEFDTNSLGPNHAIDCNCGCGVFDPDCNLESSRNQNGVGALPLYFGGGDSDNTPPSPASVDYCTDVDDVVVQAPPGWICAARDYAEFASGNYGENGKPDCDCNCGIYDPDCDFEYLRTNNDASKIGLFCENKVESLNFAQTCSKKTLQCVTVDETFAQYCPAKWYNQYELGNIDSRGKPICDCGCGPVLDPDCNYLSLRFEGGLDVFGLSCDPSGVESNNPFQYCSLGGFDDNSTNSRCVTAPSEWTCAPNFYNEVNSLSYGLNGKPDCDCGCGVYDVDCEHQVDRFMIGTHAFGLFCNNFGDHSEVEDMRTTCEKRTNSCDRVPSGWVCPSVWYQEAITQSFVDTPTCHCGCGTFDVDCLLEGVPLVCGIDGTLVENGLDLFECTLDCPFCKRR